MKKITTTTFIVLFILFELVSQEAGPYAPLDFKNVTPNWIHLSVDSTIIGYQDSLARNATYDGTSHLNYSHQWLPPTIEDGYLYLSMRATVGGATGGGVIEKIDLETGKSVWKDVFDLRNTNERDMPILTRIEGDTLLVFGYHSLPDGNIRSLSFVGNLSIKKYNKHTGILFEEFHADETQADNHRFNSNHFFEYDSLNRKFRYYHQYGGFIGKEGLMVRKTINLKGQLEAIDTIRGAISHYSASLEDFVIRRSTFQTHKKQLYYVETYAPIDTGLVQSENHAAISKYDEGGNLIFSKKIPDTDLDSFEWLFLTNVTDEFIFLEGYNTYSRDEQFYLILDKDANFVKKVNSFYDGRFLNLNICPAQNNSQETLFFQNRYNFSSEQGSVEVYRADENGQLELLKTLERDIENYSLGIDWGLYLENGDIFTYVFHSYIEGANTFPTGYFKNWVRFAPEELGLPPAVNPTEEVTQPMNFTIYPNPATNKVTILAEKPINQLLNLKVFDMLGTLVLNQKIDSNETTFNISTLAAGTYVVSLTNSVSGRVSVSKLIKLE